VKFPRRALSLRIIATRILPPLALALTLTLALSMPLRLAVPAAAAVGRCFAIAWSELDFQFVQFVPLRFGPLAVRYRQQFLHAAARRRRLRWIIHPPIIPLFGRDGE